MADTRFTTHERALRSLVIAITSVTAAALVVAVIPHVGRTRGFVPFMGFAAWVIAPGLVVWLHPRVSIALLWSALAWFGFLMSFGMPWPGPAIAAIMAPVVAVLLFGIPIYAAVGKLAGVRAARRARPRPPVARVVTRRRA